MVPLAIGVGRGVGGLGLPWILKFSAKEGCFLSFGGKIKFHHFWSPPGKIQEKSTSAPPGKNPSGAHAVSCAEGESHN